MFDNPLIALLRTTILAQEADYGIPNKPLAQAFQPVRQGVPQGPSLFLHKVGDMRRGQRSMTDVWDATNSRMVHTEQQLYETTFQISGLDTQEPTTPEKQTASDLVNLCASIMQSQQTVEILQAQNVGVLRIDQVRNTSIVDDRDRHTFQPSFDFIISHSQVITIAGKAITKVDLQILPV